MAGIKRPKFAQLWNEKMELGSNNKSTWHLKVLQVGKALSYTVFHLFFMSAWGVLTLHLMKLKSGEEKRIDEGHGAKSCECLYIYS